MAIEALEPEAYARRGSSSAEEQAPKTARYLAGKGFSQDAIESACAEAVADDAPPAVF